MLPELEVQAEVPPVFTHQRGTQTALLHCQVREHLKGGKGYNDKVKCMKTNLFSMCASSEVKAIQQQLRCFGSFVKKDNNLNTQHISNHWQGLVSISFSDQKKHKKRD